MEFKKKIFFFQVSITQVDLAPQHMQSVYIQGGLKCWASSIFEPS